MAAFYGDNPTIHADRRLRAYKASISAHGQRAYLGSVFGLHMPFLTYCARPMPARILSWSRSAARDMKASCSRGRK